MAKKQPSSSLFARLKQGLEEGIAHERGETQLREREIILPPAPRAYTPDDVRELRERLALSQGSLAKILHVSIKTIQAWEQGLRVPSQSAARLLQELERPGTIREALVGLAAAESGGPLPEPHPPRSRQAVRA